jgi:predicted XRE-type DNA-binding protein
MKTTYRLTYDDAVDVWLRHWAGEFQHEIAAAYGVNQGRVNEVLKEHLHDGSKKTAAAKRSAA